MTISAANFDNIYHYVLQHSPHELQWLSHDFNCVTCYVWNFNPNLVKNDTFFNSYMENDMRNIISHPIGFNTWITKYSHPNFLSAPWSLAFIFDIRPFGTNSSFCPHRFGNTIGSYPISGTNYLNDAQNIHSPHTCIDYDIFAGLHTKMKKCFEGLFTRVLGIERIDRWYQLQFDYLQWALSWLACWQ